MLTLDCQGLFAEFINLHYWEWCHRFLIHSEWERKQVIPDDNILPGLANSK